MKRFVNLNVYIYLNLIVIFSSNAFADNTGLRFIGKSEPQSGPCFLEVLAEGYATPERKRSDYFAVVLSSFLKNPIEVRWQDENTLAGRNEQQDAIEIFAEDGKTISDARNYDAFMFHVDHYHVYQCLDLVALYFN